MKWRLKNLAIMPGSTPQAQIHSNQRVDGGAHLSIKLDDPSFTAPIYASLFADEDGKTFNLIWSRARTSNGH
ncbi:MAG: DUF736 family protein [Novosphingobium sp.]|nr:DUF736 family protein [Novosphingobium sp.]